MMTFSELKKKSVVNVLDGKKLGKIKDMTFTFPEGKITAFVVGETKLFSGADDYIVNLCCVNKIGDDAVLVSLRSAQCVGDAVDETTDE